MDAALVGTLGAVSFGAELLFGVPMGMLSDAIAPRALMTGGALLGAVATQMFGMTGWVSIFFLSRAIEGLGAAAGAPPLLAHITDVTEGDPALRARAMSYFELSLLAGLALGGLARRSTLARFSHQRIRRRCIDLPAVRRASLLRSGGKPGARRREALAGFWRALRQPSLRRLAPVWLCVNAIIGLWLGPTLTFLLTQKTRSGSQFLAGIFADQPERVGWLLLGYSLVFGAGVTAGALSCRACRSFGHCESRLWRCSPSASGLFLLNHSGGQVPTASRWAIGVGTAICIMVESGFTPAALSLLAGAVGAQAGRGAAMGIYSVLLSIGAIGGSLWPPRRWAIDSQWTDLIYGTVAMAVVAMALLGRLHPGEGVHGGA